MSRSILLSGDRVVWPVNGRRRRCVVQDILPIAQESIPLRWKKKTVWVERNQVRKLPSR